MDSIKNIIGGGIITLLIGGVAYNFTQEDVINNLAEDTELTQEQAEQYINDIPQDELVSWSKVGSEYINESEKTFELVNEMDCINYEYEWESTTLTCDSAKIHLQKMAEVEQALGQAYIRLDSDTATEVDIRTVIKYLDQINTVYQHPISVILLDGPVLDEIIMTNSYNKSVLKAALESS